MPHASFLRNHGKTARSPRRPFEKQRLDIEMKLIGEFGLKNKREVWRTQLTLAKIRKAARVLLTLDEKDPKRLFEGGALMRCAACPASWQLLARGSGRPQSHPCMCLSDDCCGWECSTRPSPSLITCSR